MISALLLTLSHLGAEAVNQSQPISSRHANYFAALRTASRCRERQYIAFCPIWTTLNEGLSLENRYIYYTHSSRGSLDIPPDKLYGAV